MVSLSFKPVRGLQFCSNCALKFQPSQLYCERFADILLVEWFSFMLDPKSGLFGAVIARAVNGDIEAGQLILAEFSSVIARELRTQRRFQSLQTRLDSADIVQSVWRSFFSAVVSGSAIFRESQEVAAYLAKLTRNKIESQLRRHRALKRDIRKTMSASSLQLEATNVVTPDQTASTLELLQKVIGSLTPDERRIAHRRADGATWEELATELHMSAEALRKRHVRAAALRHTGTG